MVGAMGCMGMLKQGGQCTYSDSECTLGMDFRNEAFSLCGQQDLHQEASCPAVADPHLAAVGRRYLAHDQKPQPMAQLHPAPAPHHIVGRVPDRLQLLVRDPCAIVLKKDMDFHVLSNSQKHNPEGCHIGMTLQSTATRMKNTGQSQSLGRITAAASGKHHSRTTVMS